MRVKNNNKMNICIRAAIYSFVLLFPLIGKSQQKLPTHKNFDKGLQKETRTTLGVPGAKYWQNTASYDINAEIIPGEKKLIGTESIHYQNNSPDSLITTPLCTSSGCTTSSLIVPFLYKF